MRGCREEAEQLAERERDDEEGVRGPRRATSSDADNVQIGTGRLWAPTGWCELAWSGRGVLLAGQGRVFLGGGSGTARCRAPLAVPTAPGPCC